MKFQLKAKEAITLVFVLLSLGSAIYVVAATLNYSRFYPALGDIQLKVSRVDLDRDIASNRTILRANVSVANPTDYAGFKVATFFLKTFFVHQTPPNASLFTGDPLIASEAVAKPFGPRSVIFSELVVPMSPEQASSLILFNETYNGQISAHTLFTVEINTFLDPVTGRLALVKDETLPVS